jgi:hypothetical protein
MIVRVIGVLAIGALASYYLDPVSGRRRRALLRDKLVSNRAHGFVAEARGRVERRLGQRRQADSQVHVDPSSHLPS